MISMQLLLTDRYIIHRFLEQEYRLQCANLAILSTRCLEFIIILSALCIPLVSHSVSIGDSQCIGCWVIGLFFLLFQIKLHS